MLNKREGKERRRGRMGRGRDRKGGRVGPEFFRTACERMWAKGTRFTSFPQRERVLCPTRRHNKGLSCCHRNTVVWSEMNLTDGFFCDSLLALNLSRIAMCGIYCSWVLKLKMAICGTHVWYVKQKYIVGQSDLKRSMVTGCWTHSPRQQTESAG